MNARNAQTLMLFFGHYKLEALTSQKLDSISAQNAEAFLENTERFIYLLISIVLWH